MRCCVCSEVERTEEDLRVHITVRHVRYIPLECHHCDHVFLPTLHSLTKHYGAVHRNKLPVAVATLSYDAEKAAKVEELVTQSQNNTNGILETEPSPKRKRQPQTQHLQKRLKACKKREKFVKTQEDPCNDSDDAETGENSQKNVEEPKKNEEKNQLEFWLNERNENANKIQEKDHNNSLIKSDTANEMHSPMESANDVSNKHHHQEAEPDKKNNQNASTLASDTGETETIEDGLKLYIDEESHTTEEQPEQPLDQDNDGLVKCQNTTEIELSDNESKSDNSIFACMQQHHEENEPVPATSPLVASTSSPTVLSSLSLLFGEETNVSTSKDRRGRPFITRDCAICGKTSFKKADERKQHIWNEHMPMNRYGCLICPLIRTSRLEGIQQHVHRYHAGDASLIEDAKTEVIDMYNATRLEAFPSCTKKVETVKIELDEENEKEQAEGGAETDSSMNDANRTSRGEQIDSVGSRSPTHTVLSRKIIKPVKIVQCAAPLRCQLCTKTVAAKSKGQHIWGNHVQTPRYECSVCDYKAAYTGKIKGHMWMKHPESTDLFTDRSQELHEKYKEYFLQAFGDAAAAETPSSSTRVSENSKPALTETCSVCGEAPFRNEMARITHLWRKHMPRERYSCQLCPQMKTSRSDYIKLHVGRYHGGDVELVEDAKVELQQLYTDIRQRAFPVGHDENEQGTPATGRKRNSAKTPNGVSDGNETPSTVKRNREAK